MKRLTVQYGELVLFDGEVAECAFTDSEQAVTVTGRVGKAKPNLLEVLAKRKDSDG